MQSLALLFGACPATAAVDDRPWEIYLFSIDPMEMHDLAGKIPNKVKDMNAIENRVTPLPGDLGVDCLKLD